MPDDGAARSAVNQIMDRVAERFMAQTFQSLVSAIAKRPDTLEKVHRLLAVEHMAFSVSKAAGTYHTRTAHVAGSWGIALHGEVREVWRRLYGRRPMRNPDQNAMVRELMTNDAELMGILGLEVEWTPDVKRIDPDLDLKATDLDEGLS
jgi:hypothetical protein